MRGKLSAAVWGVSRTRNIPAYAGKTIIAWVRAVLAAEHPRVCGENPILAGNLCPFLGTSPRMRGKPAHMVGLEKPLGNIPAYAGKRRSIVPH